ncbi:hypothetical protein ACFYM3_04185 [Streptomyces massasporeus]|uniref:Uncharacterized protein n=1 Tax=Streptomyces massasporeus TaxID=67324 RepID=A0ABW6L9T5_9ACTN
MPRENVIGSAPEFAWRDGVPVRRAVLHGPVAIGPGKPQYVLARTGRQPRFAAGNDDDVREYACTEGEERARATARREGWTTVSVKDDWKTVLKERSDEEEPE